MECPKCKGLGHIWEKSFQLLSYLHICRICWGKGNIEEKNNFVEWHNKRTVNSIDAPEDCRCILKNEWEELKSGQVGEIR